MNWSLLWDQVLPAWLSVLSQSLEPSSFYERYVPAGDTYGDLLEDKFGAPAEYLALFNAPLQPPYARAELYLLGKCSSFLRVADTSASPYLLAAAIKQTAAVDLPGVDPFAGNYFASSEDRSGRKQVAGTKNRYLFLESAFEVIWREKDDEYAYSRRSGVASDRLLELLESLFLYQNVIPGAGFPKTSPTWPGYDDLSFAGYLSPLEVVSLQRELMAWEPATLANDELFALFSNRVARAADCGAGLLTIHAGL